MHAPIHTRARTHTHTQRELAVRQLQAHRAQGLEHLVRVPFSPSASASDAGRGLWVSGAEGRALKERAGCHPLAATSHAGVRSTRDDQYLTCIRVEWSSDRDSWPFSSLSICLKWFARASLTLSLPPFLPPSLSPSLLPYLPPFPPLFLTLSRHEASTITGFSSSCS